MPKGPRGFQCPKCWKAGRLDAKDRPPLLSVTNTVAVAPLVKRRYRQCPLCGHCEITIERPRSDEQPEVRHAKDNKLPSQKRKRC